MGAGVVQVLALQIDPGAAEGRGQPFGKIKRARPADIVLQVVVEFGGKGGIGLGGCVGLFDRENQRHQRLGDVAPAEDAEMTALIGPGAEGVSVLHKPA